ncbi:MAG: hypothetical protein IT436_16235 [Phycisphaerales bacterium]|nr:hypothetical protein [Phycisphaerales bacterium]
MATLESIASKLLCPICGEYGRLHFVKDGLGRVLLQCDECTASFRDAESASSSNGNLGTPADTAAALPADIDAAGMSDLVLQDGIPGEGQTKSSSP